MTRLALLLRDWQATGPDGAELLWCALAAGLVLVAFSFLWPRS